ncbi:simple sugar transport system permease protein [Devosia subaequoris]|uniref:Simple sugar transport system permease protein n=1 Tax=Devosia subaequoris TaxID=395930 RepID=A0A7W6ND95_9HYPH|nr:ABC transporter permease [Devosia subaequoris]MBB4053937.1 simple sugar transport system permease protein [Devosia subaequoris]MCP1211441.1 ABC transporter permease [Devosia subaequoris]
MDIVEVLYSAVRVSTPLVYAAMGGLLTYQAGMLNIALDGFMIVAAFAGIATAFATGSLELALIAAVISSVLLAALMATFTFRFKADIFIAGIAVTFLAYGLTALLLKGVLGEDGVFMSNTIPRFSPIVLPFIADIPVLGRILSGHTILVYVAYLFIPVIAFALYSTRWGLRVRMVGEAPEAAAAAGVKVTSLKFQTMLLSGALCGFGGAYLSLAYVSLFANQMTAERGLIALAAIFFAKGRPLPTALVALLFGLATALSVRLPQVTGAAPQLLQLIPYVVTVLALVIVGVRTARASNKHGAWKFALD